MISVCIPTFNGEAFIEEQVRSILAQLDINDEIVISDDNSTDSTISKINSIGDKRIKIFQNYRSKRDDQRDTLYKVSLNVQNALKNAKGDYIYLSDQDDIWIEGRIENTIEFLKANEPRLVVCNCKIIDEQKKIIVDSYFKYIKPSSSFFRTLYKSSFHGCCMSFNRKLVEKAFPFPFESLGHDLWIGLTAILYGKIEFTDKPLIHYRRHSATVTTTGFKSGASLSFKVSYRIRAIKAILRKIFKRVNENN